MIRWETDVTLRDAVFYAVESCSYFSAQERPVVAEALTAQIGKMYSLNYGMAQIRIFGMIMGFKPLPSDTTALIAEIER